MNAAYIQMIALSTQRKVREIHHKSRGIKMEFQPWLLLCRKKARDQGVATLKYFGNLDWKGSWAIGNTPDKAVEIAFERKNLPSERSEQFIATIEELDAICYDPVDLVDDPVDGLGFMDLYYPVIK